MKKLSTIALLGMVSGMVFAKAPENYTRHIEVCADASVLEGVTLENVPVLVRLSESISGFSYEDFQADGLDLLFQDQVGAELPFEVDTWNPGGESLVWVKVPSLTKGTILHLYFGGEANVGSSADVWSEYAGVWHLSEADGVALDSTSHELHGTPMGSAAAAMVSTSGAIGSARVNSGNKSYLSIPNYNVLGLGNTFTISAWFKANAVSGYPRYFSRKNSYADNDGWEIEAVNNSKTSLTARGVLNNKTVKSTFPDITKDWVFLSFVYNGANLSVYANGVLSASGAIDPATDNGRPMSIGSDSDGSETSFNGQFDEARLRDGCVDAAWVAAEYAMATDASFFTYGAVESTDSNTPFIAPGLELGLVNGVWTLSGTLASGCGTVYGVVTELFSGVAITSQVATADATVAPVAFSGALSSIPAGSMYSFYGFVESAQGGRSRMLGSYAIYSGEVSVEKVSDAQEASLAPGAFVVRRADTPAATAADLLVTYSISGTAVEGVTHEPLTGSLVLPAGVASVTLDVVPLFAPSVTEDTTVIVTLNQERAVVGNAGSATLTVVHSEENQFIRYVSPEGDDANDGLLPTKAKASIDGAVAVLNELVDEAHVGTVLVAAGTYTESGDTAVKVSESRGPRSDYSTNAVHIAAPIRVVGMTGNPEDVILTTSGNRRIAFLNHPKAAL